MAWRGGDGGGEAELAVGLHCGKYQWRTAIWDLENRKGPLTVGMDEQKGGCASPLKPPNAPRRRRVNPDKPALPSDEEVTRLQGSFNSMMRMESLKADEEEGTDGGAGSPCSADDAFPSGDGDDDRTK